MRPYEQQVGNWLAAWSLGSEEAEDAFQQLMANPDVDEQAKAKSKLSQEHERRKVFVPEHADSKTSMGGCAPSSMEGHKPMPPARASTSASTPRGGSRPDLWTGAQLPATEQALIDQRNASAGASTASAGASASRAGYYDAQTDKLGQPKPPKPPTRQEFERGFDKALKQLRQDAGIWEKEDSTGRNVFTGEYYPEKLRKFGAEAVADSTMTAKQWARKAGV